jgi:hypothetical protein
VSTGTNTGYLTFKPAGYKGTENYYQGVFFKWGSLVGVSPVGGNYVAGNVSTTGTTLYVPAYNSSSARSSTWEATTGYAMGWTSSWAASSYNIPYVNASFTGSRVSNYLTSLGSTLYASYRGDI